MGAPLTDHYEIPREPNETGIADATTFNAAMDFLDDLLFEGSIFGDKSWKSPVADFASLPVVGNELGDVRQTLDDGALYRWDGVLWQPATSQGALIYQGVWNAATNTPPLSDATGAKGQYYVVDTSGSQDLGSGLISFSVGDWAIHNGSIWEKADHTDVVTSVFGRQGAVVAQSGDYQHSQIGGIGSSDHHVRPIDGELLPAAHAPSHQHGGADEVATATAAANAIPKAGSDGRLASGWLPVHCWDVAFGSSTGAGFNSGSATPTTMRLKTFPGTLLFGTPIRACITALSSSGNPGWVELYRPSTGQVICTIGPITATTPTVYDSTVFANLPTTEEVLDVRVYRGVGATTLTIYDFTMGTY